jgi:choline dehydrogenase-like flavoprotein
MFIDARTLAKDTQIDTDVCIVGAGAAGITIARELIDQPFRVCLLESGGLGRHEDTQALYRGNIVGFPYYPLDLTRLRYFGGTTNHWAGGCRPLEEIDFETRPEIPHSGWPFPKSHLDPFYQRAHHLCQLGPYDYNPANWETEENPCLSMVGNRVATAIHQESPPTRFGQIYREEIEQAQNISTYLFANVVEIGTTAAADRVTRLSMATLQGNHFSVTARFFILATGAIENARLLLVSNKVQNTGLGNQHDLVGRFFMDHLSIPGGLLLPSLDLGSCAGLYITRGKFNGVGGVGYLMLTPETLRREKLLSVRAFVRSASPQELARGTTGWSISAQALLGAARTRNLDIDFAGHLANVIRNTDEVAIYVYRKFFRRPRGIFFSLYYQLEHAPNPDSRVTLVPERDQLGMPRVQLTWRFGDLERRTLQRANEIIGQEFGRAGFGRVSAVHDDPNTGWPAGLRGSWHQIGTTRMHPDPKQGVVDEQCQVHGVANLFIAGSSVFPTSGYMNPTLTIVALSIRLADHVTQLMR